MYLDNDGMLICENAILGKAGTQAYVGYELGLDSKEIILVHRPEKEVFDKESLSSLKGKTLTLNHPDEDVSINNHSYLSKGFVLDVRQQGNLIVGDIKITDPDTIELIRDKKMVELSLGYETKLEVNDNNELVQTRIVYNHLALVKKGRAEVARIVDRDKTRVVDKQFEEGEMVLEKNTILEKVLNVLGLKKRQEGDETVFVLDTQEEVVEKNETKEEVVDEVEVSEEEALKGAVEENAEKSSEEETKVSDTEEDKEETVDDAESDKESKEDEEKDKPKEKEKVSDTVTQTLTDIKTEEGEKDMDKLDILMAKMEKIQKIEDADFREVLKKNILKEVQDETVKVEDESNEALEDFKNVKLEDNKIDMVDFDKEIQTLYDNLNPHNYDSYEDYVKYRKKINKESSAVEIQKLVDEGLGGL